MEIRFFTPGTLVRNLDFVETIFGNAGDPDLPENDAGLDVKHWRATRAASSWLRTLAQVTKKDVGLPPYDPANERQRRDGMCWRDPAELYNDGRAFKLTCRDANGVIVTLIADSYTATARRR